MDFLSETIYWLNHDHEVASQSRLLCQDNFTSDTDAMRPNAAWLWSVKDHDFNVGSEAFDICCEHFK
jgi:hypothetical protein